MKTVVFIALSTLCLMAGGCGRIYGPVKEMKAYLDDKDDMIIQMSKKLEANPNASGADEARKIFDARKEGIKAKYKAMDEAPQGINSDWRSTLASGESVENDAMMAIVVKFGMDCKGDGCSDAEDKMRKIRNECYMLNE